MPDTLKEDCAVGTIHSVLERYREPGWVFTPTPDRPTEGLTLILKGQMRLDRIGESLVFGSDQVVFLQKSAKYQIAIHGQEALHFLVVNYDLQPGSVPLAKDAVALSGEGAHRVRDWFHQMARCFETQEPWFHLRCRALLQQTLYEIAHARMQTSAPPDPRVEAALNYLRNYYGAEIGVADVARAIGLSVTHLRRLFVAELGIPPHAHLQRLRIERAKMLLQGGLHSVGEIANLCGFSSVYYFSRAFKQETGSPPTKWRHT